MIGSSEPTISSVAVALLLMTYCAPMAIYARRTKADTSHHSLSSQPGDRKLTTPHAFVCMPYILNTP